MVVDVVTSPTWRSPSLAVFDAIAATIESRLGPPTERDLDSNGLGLYDALCVRFACGLEVGLMRFHLGAGLRTIDPATEPSLYEIHANHPDLDHIAFHLEVPVDAMHAFTAAPPNIVIVMRTDDNGNDAEVTRVSSRCEAEAVVRSYEARAHKQSYWIAG